VPVIGWLLRDARERFYPGRVWILNAGSAARWLRTNFRRTKIRSQKVDVEVDVNPAKNIGRPVFFADTRFAVVFPFPVTLEIQ